MKRLTIPLASYLAVTVVVPILNGAPIDAAFLEHTLLAVTLPLTILAIVGTRYPSESLLISSAWRAYCENSIRKRTVVGVEPTRGESMR